jgi:hypothetical protein
MRPERVYRSGHHETRNLAGGALHVIEAQGSLAQWEMRRFSMRNCTPRHVRAQSVPVVSRLPACVVEWDCRARGTTAHRTRGLPTVHATQSSVHASKMKRSDARGSWQLLLVQLWEDPPLHPDVIVEDRPDMAHSAQEQRKRPNKKLSIFAQPRSVSTAGARSRRAPLRVPGRLQACQRSGNGTEVVLASDRLHMAAAGLKRRKTPWQATTML